MSSASDQGTGRQVSQLVVRVLGGETFCPKKNCYYWFLGPIWTLDLKSKIFFLDDLMFSQLIPTFGI